jgi:hypothetical protein
VKAIEQLANLEARTGEKKGDERGLALIERAIERLEGLRACTLRLTTGEGHAAREPTLAPRVNVERCSLLGSALKRKAAILARLDTAHWNQISDALQRSRDAYREGEGGAVTGQFDPYPALNRLQLDGLLQDFKPEEKEQLTQLAARCAELARQRFASSYDFFDAAMVADADLAQSMIDGSLKASADRLAQAYLGAVSSVPTGARQFDSVVRQLELLAQFYSLRREGDDSLCAEALRKIAKKLAPNSAAATTATSSRKDSSSSEPPVEANEVSGEKTGIRPDSGMQAASKPPRGRRKPKRKA